MIFNLLFLFVFNASACEAPPAPGAFCEKTKLIKYDQASGDALLKALEDFNAHILKTVKEESPKDYERIGDGSCFLMNHEEMYLSQFADHAKSNKGKICTANFKWLDNDLSKIVSNKVSDYPFIKSPAAKNKAQLLKTTLESKLKDFRTKHPY